MAFPSAHPPESVVRFGVFEVDLASGELRRAGRKVRLQEQPFQVLALLLTHPGSLVTREELRLKLWPVDTFVDFDHSLNTAINKVRDALGDSAANPRFVETIAKRGYRFLAPITRSAGGDDRQNMETNPGFARKDVVARAIHPELHLPLPHRNVSRGLFALIQVMYVTFYLEALFHWTHLDHAVAGFLTGRAPLTVAVLVVVTAAVGIVVRCYLLSALAFDYRLLRANFEKLFLAVLVFDDLWALAPFLLAYYIGFGTALGATAALLYVPFAERTLLRMAFPKDPLPDHQTATIRAGE